LTPTSIAFGSFSFASAGAAVAPQSEQGQAEPPGVKVGVGVEVGVLVATSLPEHVLRRLFAAFLLVTAAHIVWRVRRA
jgi:uncharacterized membrane protein YfcA